LNPGSDLAGNALEIAREALEQGREITAGPQSRIATLLAGPAELVSQIESQLCSVCSADAPMDVTVVPGPRASRGLWQEGMQDDQGDQTAECVIAAGLLELAVGSKQPYTNLIPCRYLAKERRKILLARCLRIGIMAVLLVSLAWACLGATDRRLGRASRMIEAQIAPIAKVAGGVDRKRQRLKAIQRQLSNRGRIAETIAELYECTPGEISISELDVAWKQGAMTIDIKGQADLLPAAFEYTDAVRNSRLLRAMQIINAQQIPRAQGGSTVEFKASCLVPEDSVGGKP
jgi:hypothetical protein